jgi:tubulin polyglutamylase TTLL6/13
MQEEASKAKKKPVTKVIANVTNTRYGIVKTCCEDLGFKVSSSDRKSILFWCDAGGNFEFTSTMQPWQFYNHFPGTWAIARKVDLARNIERMARLLPDLYNFHPKSFIVPCQTSDLQAYMIALSRKSRRTFIVKPDRGSLGKGIVLIRDPDVLDDWYDLAIAQEYISPYLIDNLKFDLRIYALITSAEPLRIYLHDEGMARFCTHPYSKPSAANLRVSFAHLTNYSLNKHNPHFEEPEDPEHADFGHKRSMSSVFRLMEERGVNVSKLKVQIENIVRLTVISIQPLLATNYRTAIPWHDGRSRCFEVLGFDIMIDKGGLPWLLEVNWAPSLATGSPFDTSIKTSVVKGALTIANINPNFKRIVAHRRKVLSQAREPPPVFFLDDEFEAAKNTHYNLIYPVPESHPLHDEIELAVSQSKISTVGAGVTPARARAKKEALVAQYHEQLPKPKEVKETIVVRPKPQEPAVIVKPKESVVRSVPQQKAILPRYHQWKPFPTPRPMIAKAVIQTQEPITLMILFERVQGEVIDINQEKERIQQLRRQLCAAQMLGLAAKVNRIVTLASEIGRDIVIPAPFHAQSVGDGIMIVPCKL